MRYREDQGIRRTCYAGFRLPRIRFLDVTPLRDIQKTAARETTQTGDDVNVNISMRKMVLEVGYSKSMIYEILNIFRRIKTFILL